ncbi:hypothetical protein [Leptospira bouyouniensis]|uniref:hypothetical protein n=1 Tax=Leptospira bouyouniensis TaxID=2484911 RepID=UPI001091453A|nr:hypothetical protein [Leptospira bouyouniensis]TGM77966.1 hypothetical protein EHQ99_16660 [Leptospira bouyouniensis]
MNAKKAKLGKERRIVSAVLLTTFAFVLVCTAGFFPCPKIGFSNEKIGPDNLQEIAMPCHSQSNENGSAGEPTKEDSCQCDEISNSEGIAFQIEFSKLVRVSFLKLYVLSQLDLPILSLEWHQYRSISESFPNHNQVQQKTVKLLI